MFSYTSGGVNVVNAAWVLFFPPPNLFIPVYNSYIGMTTTTLSRRLTMHLQSGAIKAHFQQKHGSAPTRQDLVDNTRVLHRDSDAGRLSILEALLILERKPAINNQVTGYQRTLKVFHS